MRVVSSYDRRNGITTGASLQAEALKREGLDVAKIDSTNALRNPFYRAEHEAGNVYIFHSGGPEIGNLILSTLPKSRGAYRIAYWAWELPTPPSGWPTPRSVVSEVWTPSAFAKRALSTTCDLPLRVVPHRVQQKTQRFRTMDKPFTVLAMADSRSSFARKNPIAAVDAFIRAFGERPDVKLVLKLNGGPAALNEFDAALGCRTKYRNIQILSGFKSSAEMDKLYDETDVLMSLHRAEGFGLPMLEAMARGVAVVATAWSGNMDFMDETCACLVDYDIVPVRDRRLYSRYLNSTWAEPNIDTAAAALSRLYQERDFYDAISQRGWLMAGRQDNLWLQKVKAAGVSLRASR